MMFRLSIQLQEGNKIFNVEISKNKREKEVLDFMKNKWISRKVEELKPSPIRKVFNNVVSLSNGIVGKKKCII